jgi:hypothetical protein
MEAIANEKTELVRVTKIVAEAIMQRGGNVDPGKLEQVHSLLEQVIEEVRGQRTQKFTIFRFWCTFVNCLAPSSPFWTY